MPALLTGGLPTEGVLLGRHSLEVVRVQTQSHATEMVEHVPVWDSANERLVRQAVHAHRLRHTAATQLLRAGASLPEVGQVLRHRRAHTTAIYAKVDHDTLRVIARPWPEDAQ